MSQWVRPPIEPLPRGQHLVRFLATRPEFVGIGPATAQRMWDTFDEDLACILGAGDVERLAQVLPRTQAEIVCDAWRAQQTITDAVIWFDEIGIDHRLARKAVEFWGDDAVAKLRENPYRLLTICSWRQVDGVARMLGIAPEDQRRWVGAVEAALYDRLDDKHTVTSHDELLHRTIQLLSAPRAAAEQALAAAVQDGAAIPCFAGYQPAGAAYAERYIEIRLAAALDAPERQRDLLAGQITPEALTNFLSSAKGSAAHRLTEEQADAVRMALSHRFSILSGGAGVGKTTTLRAITDAAVWFGLHVYQLALSGRAAQRMADATGRPAQTIALWLNQAAQGRAETSTHTLVIVDEASMLDLPTMYRLLFHIHDDARLLLVGDTAQLPPIGYGLTLHRLVQSHRIPRVELTRILRANETTGIPLVSRAIRDGQVPPLAGYEAGKAGCSFIACQQHAIIDAIEQIRDDLRSQEVQVIAGTYAGVAGIDAINTHFHRYNAHGELRLYRFAAGDPVIWTENDYDLGLWNGSMGQVLAVEGEHLRLRLDGQEFSLHQDDVAGRLDLAYAISCHKAQGSQWETVILPLSPSRLMDRTLLYTALTRAQQRVILIGDRNFLKQTVTRPPASLARDVALSI